MPKKTDWAGLIEKLQAREKELKPGDCNILDIEAAIQDIKAYVFGGDTGHAVLLLNNPKERKSLERGIRGNVRELLG